MIDKLYYKFRKLITKDDEQNQYSGGLWPRLAREAGAALYTDLKGNLIELGCGEGLFLELMAQKNPGATVHGIDFRSLIIDVAKERLLPKFKNIKLYTGNALTTQLEGQLFDYTYCMNTVLNLPSVDDIRSLFLEAHRITKPGGKFIFDIRNSWSPIIQAQYRLVRFYDTGITVPVRYYTKNFIARLVSECGFEVLETKYIGFPENMFAPIVLFVARKR